MTLQKCKCGNLISKIWGGDQCIPCQNALISNRKRKKSKYIRQIKQKQISNMRSFSVWKLRSEGATLDECAKSIGVSKERARQIIDKESRRMRANEISMRAAQSSIKVIAEDFLQDLKMVERRKLYAMHQEKLKLSEQENLIKEIFKHCNNFEEKSSIAAMLLLLNKSTLKQLIEKIERRSNQ